MAMIPEKRRQFLLDRLKDVDVLSITEVAEALGVSQMTVRRDIRALENDGHVVSVSGGVKSTARIISEPPFQAKMRADVGYKRAIARAAALLVTDGQSIYIDAGTTGFQLAPLITNRKRLTVVTNDFTTAAFLIDHPAIELFHTGGRVEHANRSAVGSLAAALLENVNFDIAFMSTSSWDVKHGVTTPSESKVVVKRRAMSAASRRVLIADSTKYGQFGMFKVADIDAFDCIITDTRLPQSEIDEIERRKVEVTAVSEVFQVRKQERAS